MKVKQLPVPENFERSLKLEGSLWVKIICSDTGLNMIYSLDQTQHGRLHHLSISRPERYPNWDEIFSAKEIIMGNIDVMMILPRKEDYVNLHKNCFHLWETPEKWNIQ